MISYRRIALVTVLVLAAVLTPAALVAMRAERGRASFGDGRRIGENHLASATLSIEVGERTLPLAGRAVAPGDRLVGAIELVNDGSIPLRYAIVSEPTEGDLAPWVEWRFDWSPDSVTCPGTLGRSARMHSGVELAAGIAIVGNPATGSQPGDRRLGIGGRDLLCATASLSFDAPNSVQSTMLAQRFTVWAEQDAP